MHNDSKSRAPSHRSNGLQFGMTDKAVTRDPALSTAVKAVYQLLAEYVDANNECWPARATIAEHLGISPRTVDTAIKQGVAAGLWTVEHRNGDDGRMTSNLYRLHDFGRGFVASNARGAESAPLARGADFVPGPGTKVAHELDHQNKTIYADRGHSSEGTPGAPAPDGGRRAPSQLRLVEPDPQPNEQPAEAPRPKRVVVLGRPRDLYRRTADDARAYACRAVIAAAKKAGRPLGQNAAGPLDYHLRSHVCADMTNHELVARAEEVVNLAMHGDPIWSHLFDDEIRAPREVGPDTLDALHEELDGYVGGATTVDSMWYRGRRPAEIYNTVIKQNGLGA